jgi:hypothetical protein
VSSIWLAEVLELFFFDAMWCVETNHCGRQNCWWRVPFRVKKHYSSLWNTDDMSKSKTPSEHKSVFYSTGIRPINYSYRGIYRRRLTYPSLLLHLFAPQPLYSSNILGAYSKSLSNHPLQLITPFSQPRTTVFLVVDLQHLCSARSSTTPSAENLALPSASQPFRAASPSRPSARRP